VSDSLRERKGQCEVCSRLRENVDIHTRWTCGECYAKRERDEARAQVETLGSRLCEYHDTNPLNEVVERLEKEREAAWQSRDQWRDRARKAEAGAQWATKERDDLQRALDQQRAAHRVTAALVRECREWLINRGAEGRKLGYVEFRNRLDEVLGDGATFPYDLREKE